MYLPISELARRVRISSWKDIVLYLVIAVLYAGCYWLLKRFFPETSHNTRRVVSVLVVLVIGIVFITVTHAFS